MARRKKRINGWMLRKKGIKRRFAIDGRSSDQVKVRDARTSPNKDMPNFFDARHKPKAGRFYYEVENPDTGAFERKWEKRPHPWYDPPPITPPADPLLLVEARRKWLNEHGGGHGVNPLNYKTVMTVGSFYEVRLYFSGMRQQYIEITEGAITRASIVYYGELADRVDEWERHKLKGVRWRETI